MRIRALILRIVRQFLNDKRSLALLFIAPILILTLMSWIFNGDTYEPKLAVIDVPDPLVQQLEQQRIVVTEMTEAEAQSAIEEAEIDAILQMAPEGPTLRLEGSDPSVTKSVLLLLQKTMQAQNPAAAEATALLQSKISYLHGSEDMAMFDSFGPVLIGVFAFFFVFMLAGVAFLRERTGGTLERLLATPLKRWEVVAGYVVGFGIFTMLQAVLIAWYAIQVLDMMMAGSLWIVLLVTMLLSLTALTLGTLLSSYANNEFQMIQFIPLVVVPQVFFSGLFNLDTMAEWLRWISYLMPLRYGADALKDVMVRGAGLADVAFDLYVLIGFSVAFMVLNVLALRKHRKI